MTFPGAYSSHQKEGIISKEMFSVHKKKREMEGTFLHVVNVEQGCI
jgi:hypothetical protein